MLLEEYAVIIYLHDDLTLFTQCTATCGGGMRKRMIKCMYRGTRKLALQMFCKMVSPAPPVFERCNTQDCPAALSTYINISYCHI